MNFSFLTSNFIKQKNARRKKKKQNYEELRIRIKCARKMKKCELKK